MTAAERRVRPTVYRAAPSWFLVALLLVNLAAVPTVYVRQRALEHRLTILNLDLETAADTLAELAAQLDACQRDRGPRHHERIGGYAAVCGADLPLARAGGYDL